MRKIFKTVVAAMASTAMVATLFAGYTAPINAAEKDVLAGITWTNDYQSWESADAAILNSTFTTTESGFKTNITTTGWQREWEASCPDGGVVVGGGWQDNPYQLRAKATVPVAAGATYQFSFTVKNDMLSEAGAPTEKNIMVTINSGIPGDTDNTMLQTCVRVPANSTKTFTFDVPVNSEYLAGAAMIEFAYGAFCYSYEVEKAGRTAELEKLPYLFAPGTTEGVACKGELTFSDVTMIGEEAVLTTTELQTRPPMDTTTKKNDLSAGNQNQNATVAPTTVAPAAKADVVKPAKVKIKKVTNLKGKKVKITWRRVNGATKYQVKVGTKKKTTKKLKLTVKVAKNKTYKVRVRAYKNGAGYGKWSNVKKVKVTK